MRLDSSFSYHWFGGGGDKYLATHADLYEQVQKQ